MFIYVQVNIRSVDYQKRRSDRAKLLRSCCRNALCLLSADEQHLSVHCSHDDRQHVRKRHNQRLLWRRSESARDPLPSTYALLKRTRTGKLCTLLQCVLVHLGVMYRFCDDAYSYTQTSSTDAASMRTCTPRRHYAICLHVISFVLSRLNVCWNNFMLAQYFTTVFGKPTLLFRGHCFVFNFS